MGNSSLFKTSLTFFIFAEQNFKQNNVNVVEFFKKEEDVVMNTSRYNETRVRPEGPEGVFDE